MAIPAPVVGKARIVGSAADASPSRNVEMERFAGSGWALDVSAIGWLVEAVAAGTEPPDWMEALFEGMRICDVNLPAVHLLGAYGGRERMIGQPVAAYWPRESRLVLAELVTAVLADGIRPAVRWRRVTSLYFDDPLLTVWTAVGDDHASTVYASIVGAVVDDRSLWSVRASEDRYRNLIHHLPTALVQVDARAVGAIFDRLRAGGVTDIDAHLQDHPELVDAANDVVQITDVNRSAMQLLGGTDLSSFTDALGYVFAASPDTARRVMVARFDGKRNHAEVMKINTFDGRLIDVQLSVTYPTPPERLDVTLLSFEDVTDRLRTQAQLRQLQADHSRAARILTLGELATSIAHEVSQPLSAIVTNGETSLRWLSRDDPNLEKVGQLTKRIVESARNASEIVQRIRGMAARHTPEQVELELNEVIEEALLVVGHDLDSRSIALSFKRGPNLKVLADRIQLQQVVVNLLVNSIQAIVHADGLNGRIDLATDTDADTVVLFIRDNGTGIAPEDLPHIFEGFFTTKEDGIGIGLAICHSIITAHGGSIAASNHSQGGAEFRLTLPNVKFPVLKTIAA